LGIAGGCLHGRGALLGSAILGRRRLVTLAAALQQWIALQLVLDIGSQIQIGELQELDRLHELRRHHERLALPDQKFLCECH
jgi:hypothetical protein